MLYFSNPHLRNRLKILIFSLLPIGIVFSVVYSEIRIGNDSELTISLSKALEILIGQETSYPLLFDKVYNFNIPFQGYNFFMWILTLPIPSFIKGNAFSLEVNYLFTELITGKSKNSKDLYILLPGLVTESYIVFGRYLFFLMPLIGATITGFLYRIIKSPIEFLPLRVYFIFMFIPLIARAGLNSAIPVAINGFIFFICFLFIKR
jgi:hypothetical protein